MKKHISVLKKWLIDGLGMLLAVIGAINVAWQMVARYWFSFQMLMVGFALVIVGMSIVVINWLVFTVRKTQLDIDYKEGIRDHIGNVCPNCGQRQPDGSKFCNNCGNSL